MKTGALLGSCDAVMCKYTWPSIVQCAQCHHVTLTCVPAVVLERTDAVAGSEQLPTRPISARNDEETASDSAAQPYTG